MKKEAISKGKIPKPLNPEKPQDIYNDNGLTDYGIKFEGRNIPKIRRKVCRKLFKILQEEFNMEKMKAKKLSLNMEYRINMSFNYKTDQGEYLDKFKKVLRYLKVYIFL